MPDFPYGAISTALAGLSLAYCYESDWVPSILVCVLFLGVATASVLNLSVGKQGSVLYAVGSIFLLAPFIHCVAYAFPGYPDINDSKVWGFAPNPFQFDRAIIARVTLLGTLSALGWYSGYALVAPRRLGYVPSGAPLRSRSLGLVSCVVLAIIAVALSWLNCPIETIFQTAYYTSQTRLDDFNINGAWLLSYCVLALLWLDALTETDLAVRKTKKLIALSTLGFVLVCFQILRGDRDSLGLVIAFIILPFMVRNRKPGAQFRLTWQMKTGLSLLLVFIFVVAQLLGAVRSVMSDTSFSDGFAEANISIDVLFSGTWSGALLTPLSVAGDRLCGALPMRWGSTYVDMFLSMPPGVVAKYMGYTRPFEQKAGPALEMHYGIGGTHACVVPFMNFGAPGVVIILGVYGALIGWLMRSYAERRTFGKTFLIAILLIAVPHVLWYGEMYLVRTLMALPILLVIHRLLSRGQSPVLERPKGPDTGQIPTKAPDPVPSPGYPR